MKIPPPPEKKKTINCNQAQLAEGRNRQLFLMLKQSRINRQLNTKHSYFSFCNKHSFLPDLHQEADFPDWERDIKEKKILIIAIIKNNSSVIYMPLNCNNMDSTGLDFGVRIILMCQHLGITVQQSCDLQLSGIQWHLRYTICNI